MCEVESVVENVEVDENENIVEFVPLNGHDDYEILNVYPYTIRKKSNHYEIKESVKNTGYVQVHLNGKNYNKHRLIAEQFIPNPHNLSCIDHMNHDRSDYHIENLRWVSYSTNLKNKSSYKGVEYTYVDDIPDESIVVDFYETRNGRREFKNYYYHDGVFYYDNDMNYRILHIITAKNGSRFVCIKDINGKKTSVVIHRFLKQHDLL